MKNIENQYVSKVPHKPCSLGQGRGDNENKNIVQGLKKLLFNDTNKFDISLLSFRDFGVGIESTEVGDPKNKWYDWIIKKYTPPGTTYTFIKSQFPFTLSFNRLIEKMVKEYLSRWKVTKIRQGNLQKN